MVTTVDELGWLHDAHVLKIVYDGSTEDRAVRIELRCPKNLGYAPWEGRDIVVIAADITAMRHVVWGVVLPESFDRIQPRVLADLRAQIMENASAGFRVPTIECTIAFHSGSTLEIACEEFQVEVGALY